MNHENFIKRTFDLARLGQGRVEPNPMVGCVIVHNGQIISEGRHEFYGGPHAEVNAFAHLTSEKESLIQECTVYVNLEPCCVNAKTPPCSELLIAKGVKKVVVSTCDPNPRINGKSLIGLREHGMEAIAGILEEEGNELNKRFFTYHNKKRPYVILKWAQTRNGFMASDRPEQKWISNKLANRLSHKWRTEEMAIMVGTNTAAIDNPQLTSRDADGRNPLRIVMDQKLRLPPNLRLFDQSTATVVYTEKEKMNDENLEFQQIEFGSSVIENVLNDLVARDITSLMVEGGPALLKSFIEKGLWDEARIITANQSWPAGKKPPTIFGNLVAEEQLGDNRLELWRNLE